MRGSVAVEYVLIVLGFAIIYLSFVSYYTSEAIYFNDVKKLLEAKTELARLAAAGSFVSTATEANVYIYIKDFGGRVSTSPLSAEVNVSGKYNTCGGGNCIVTFPYRFGVSFQIDTGPHRVVKTGGVVKVE